MSVVKCTPEERNHIDATGRKVFAPFKGIRMRNAGSQEPGEVTSGIRNADQGVWNLLKNDPESSNWNLQIMKWNPESKTFPYMERFFSVWSSAWADQTAKKRLFLL